MGGEDAPEGGGGAAAPGERRRPRRGHGGRRNPAPPLRPPPPPRPPPRAPRGFPAAARRRPQQGGPHPLACAVGREFFAAGPPSVRRSFRADTVRALLGAGADPNAVRLADLAHAVGAPRLARADSRPRSLLDEPDPAGPAFSASAAAEVVDALLRCGYRLQPQEQALLLEQWGPQSPVAAVADMHRSLPPDHPDRAALDRIRALLARPPALPRFWPWVALPEGAGWSPENHTHFVKARPESEPVAGRSAKHTHTLLSQKSP